MLSMPQVCLSYYEHEFVELACNSPTVIVCRCSPTQKADIVNLIKRHTKRRICTIGMEICIVQSHHYSLYIMQYPTIHYFWNSHAYFMLICKICN